MDTNSLTDFGLGLAIKDARRSADMTQRELAAAVGLDPSAVTRIETGDRKVLALELAAIGNAVGVPPGDLLSSVIEPWRRPSASATQLMSLMEAAAQFGVSERTLRRRIADGSLVAYRVGPKLIKINPSDLRALMTRAV